MPTAPKLIAALFFAALAWFTCDLIKAHLPEATQTGLFSPLTALIGLLLGWRFTGRKVAQTRGRGRGIGLGLATVFLITFWGLILWSGDEMVRLSMRGRYDGAFDALNGMLEIMVANLPYLAAPDVVATLLIGGVIGGWLVEWSAGRR